MTPEKYEFLTVSNENRITWKCKERAKKKKYELYRGKEWKEEKKIVKNQAGKKEGFLTEI